MFAVGAFLFSLFCAAVGALVAMLLVACFGLLR